MKDTAGGATVPLVSASQISLYRECNRKWGHRYLSGLKTPQHPSAALGTEVDDTQLQPYLREGRPLDFSRTSGYIAAPGLVLLPDPKTHDLEVQKHFILPSPSTTDYAYQGYIDLWLPRGGLPGLASKIPTVVDFKTTGNWKYAKTKTQLANDVQAQLYAAWAMHETGLDVVYLAWTYFATKGKYQAKRVHLPVMRSHVDAQLRSIDDTATEMFEVRKASPDPLELTPNPEMCGAYGGCPYSARCNLSPSENVDAMAAKWRRSKEPNMAESTMGLLARMKAKASGATPSLGTPPPVTDEDRAEAAVRVAALIAIEPEAMIVGINPPESTLPPAPAVGSVFVHEAPTAVVLTEKRKPGRPRKDPLGADAAVHTATPSAPAEVPSPSVDTLTGITVITVVWGEETICAVPYNPFKVGPFSVTAEIHGESAADAQARVYADLVTFAEEKRLAKAVSHAAFLTALGVSR